MKTICSVLLAKTKKNGYNAINCTHNAKVGSLYCGYHKKYHTDISSPKNNISKLSVFQVTSYNHEVTYFKDNTLKQHNHNQGHGKVFEGIISNYKYNVDISKYSYINKYDIEYQDNHITNNNVSIKTTNTNTVCCADALNFLSSDRCEMMIIKYKKDGDTKQIIALYSINIEDILSYNNIEKLKEFRDFIKMNKKYFQEVGNTDKFEEFKQICIKKSKNLSSDLIRINTKISTPTKNIKSNNKFKCDNFRIQCSINITNLKKRNINICDISHELDYYNIPLTIHSPSRKIK